jgi:hypothetical protein
MHGAIKPIGWRQKMAQEPYSGLWFRAIPRSGGINAKR